MQSTIDTSDISSTTSLLSLSARTRSSIVTAAGKHGLLGFSVPEKLGAPQSMTSVITRSSSTVGMLAIAVVVAKLSRQAIRPLATALALQRRFVDDASHELRARVTDTGD